MGFRIFPPRPDRPVEPAHRVPMDHPPIQLIKSAHDIGSAVAHRLKREGGRPVLLESPAPGATRRLMCFAGAVHEGRAELEGLAAVRCASAAEALRRVERPGELPLLVADLDAPPPLPPEALEVLVDARMRKRITPPAQIGLAALTIGIGPGFVAGLQVDAVIESNWGDRLGAVIRRGGTEAYTGQHREVEGLGVERYVYAPHGGVFQTERSLLETLQAGDTAGWVDDTPLAVAAGGILRGLAYPGARVEAGAKLVEIDPTGDPANASGIGPRPARIAQGVLEAIAAFRAR